MIRNHLLTCLSVPTNDLHLGYLLTQRGHLQVELHDLLISLLQLVSEPHNLLLHLRHFLLASVVVVGQLQLLSLARGHAKARGTRVGAGERWQGIGITAFPNPGRERGGGMEGERERLSTRSIPRLSGTRSSGLTPQEVLVLTPFVSGLWRDGSLRCQTRTCGGGTWLSGSKGDQ